MPITNWPNKTCGNCGMVSPNDLPKYHCLECGGDYCPSCGGSKCDEDGNIHCCRKCGVKKLPTAAAKIRASRQQS